MKTIIVDVDRCNGCHSCQVACKDEHCDQAWPPYAEAQPQTGQFWMKVRQKERGQVPLVKVSYIPVMCQHCQDAPCEKAAPAGLFERREDGLLILKPRELDSETAQKVADACPVGAIYLNEEKRIAQKCTGCAHLLDSGWKAPRCVDVCPTGALRFGEESDFPDAASADLLNKGLEGCQPLVRYKNLPKRFVGGVVIDSREDEVVIGAKVALRDGDGLVAALETDDFGDWLFEQVEPGRYSVSISAEGLHERILEVDLTEKDLYAGVTDLA